MSTPTIAQLKHCIEIAERIAALKAEMNGLLGGKAVAAPPVAKAAPPAAASKRGGKRHLSPQALANIRAAQTKRWARVKAGKAAPAATPAPAAAVPKKRGGLSEEGRRKLAAAMKKRWALARKTGGPAPTATKQ